MTQQLVSIPTLDDFSKALRELDWDTVKAISIVMQKAR
jgi:hypothetical protein